MPFADMAARLGASRLGADATHYQAGSSIGEAVRVVLSSPVDAVELGAAAMVVAEAVIRVPKAALADPAVDDVFVVGANGYRVMALGEDSRGVTWVLPCRKSEAPTMGSLAIGNGL